MVAVGSIGGAGGPQLKRLAIRFPAKLLIPSLRDVIFIWMGEGGRRRTSTPDGLRWILALQVPDTKSYDKTITKTGRRFSAGLPAMIRIRTGVRDWM